MPRAEPAVRTRRIRSVLVVVYLVLVGIFTLSPAPYDDGTAGIVDVVLAWFAATPGLGWLTRDVVEFGANVAMFVPLGALLTLRLPRLGPALVAALCLAISATIELVQALAIPSRVADPRDLLSNGSGGLTGALLVAGIVALAGRRRSRGRRGPAFAGLDAERVGAA